MKKITAVFVFIITQTFSEAQYLPLTAYKDACIASIASKIELTNDVLNYLTNERTGTAAFQILADTNSFHALERIDSYNIYFQSTKDKTDVPIDLMKAIAFVESYGRSWVVSSAGAVGVMQLMPAAAKRFGLSPSLRKSPNWNILTAGKYLRFLFGIFGEEGIVTASYHMGEGNMYEVIKITLSEFYGLDTVVDSKSANLLVQNYNLSYAKIYFLAKPGTRLYTKLTSLKDWSMDYYFRVMAAKKFLALDNTTFQTEAKRIVRGKEKTFRFLTWCRDGAFDEDEIMVASFSNKKLSKFLGWTKDGPKEDELFPLPTFYASRNTAGLAIVIGGLYQLIAAQAGITFEPVSIDEPKGVFRTCEIFAFSIYGPTGREARQSFRYVLKQLSNFGFLSFKEEDDCYLIVCTPERNKSQLLETIYLEAKTRQDF